MLYLQILLIVVLSLILGALYIEEKRKNKLRIPAGKLTELWDGSERRRYVRIRTDVPVRYTLPKEQDNSRAFKTKDISMGGICMTVSEKLAPHLKLCLQIEVEGSADPILAKGEVVWAKENSEIKNEAGIRYFDIGVEFKELLPKNKERFFSFVKKVSF
jgi:c-di-GMP-binding flagellar brake protein YcgR